MIAQLQTLLRCRLYHALVAKDPDWAISLWYVEGWWLSTIMT
jgi:hypothetical protein